MIEYSRSSTVVPEHRTGPAGPSMRTCSSSQLLIFWQQCLAKTGAKSIIDDQLCFSKSSLPSDQPTSFSDSTMDIPDHTIILYDHTLLFPDHTANFACPAIATVALSLEHGSTSAAGSGCPKFKFEQDSKLALESRGSGSGTVTDRVPALTAIRGDQTEILTFVAPSR